MEPDLRTLLREKAEEVRPDVRIPGPVLRRSRRRRVVTGVATGAVTVGAMAALFIGARFLVQETPEPRQVRPAGTPTDFYPFIYPPTQAELDTTVAEVAQGSMPMWTEPEGAAALFAVNVMGWDPNDVEASVRGDDPVSVMITNPSLNEAAGSSEDIRTAVYILQVPGSQEQPVFAVLGTEAEVMEVEPIGPDEQFGAEGTVAFRGRVGFAPEGATVVLTVPGGQGAASVGPDGRFEVSAEPAGGLDPNSLLSVALVDGSGRTLALTSSRLATPLAGQGQGGATEPLPALERPGEIPPEVAETREAILDAAVALDWDALRALIPESGFTFTFGGARDPIAYWQDLESRGHVPVIGDILPTLLGTEPARLRGIYIWPGPAAKDASEWTEEDLAILDQLADTGVLTQRENRNYQDFGYYYGWRVGIDRDGTWVFYVSGD